MIAEIAWSGAVFAAGLKHHIGPSPSRSKVVTRREPSMVSSVLPISDTDTPRSAAR